MIKTALNGENDSLSIQIKTYSEFQQLAKKVAKPSSMLSENSTLFFILTYATEFDRFCFHYILSLICLFFIFYFKFLHNFLHLFYNTPSPLSLLIKASLCSLSNKSR